MEPSSSARGPGNNFAAGRFLTGTNLKFNVEERPDLIVLGLPANKEFSAHFRTGVTYKLVSSASCPVLTIRDMAAK